MCIHIYTYTWKRSGLVFGAQAPGGCVEGTCGVGVEGSVGVLGRVDVSKVLGAQVFPQTCRVTPGVMQSPTKLNPHQKA